MRMPFAAIAGLFVVILLLVAPVRAQSPSPDAEAAARELVNTIRLADQYKVILPTIIQHLKPAIVQNRPEVGRDFDALMPVLQARMNARIDELVNAVVLIYASNFTAAELHDLIAFYNTPTGQKFLQKTPIVTQQRMLAGQKFGQSAGAEAEKQMLEELRNKGHSL
jgi:hypothetical protein